MAGAGIGHAVGGGAGPTFGDRDATGGRCERCTVALVGPPTILGGASLETTADGQKVPTGVYEPAMDGRKMRTRVRRAVDVFRRAEAAPAATREASLAAAAEWLGRAQDATGNGGVSAYFDAKKGRWAASYPETTGYIIPTLLRYAKLSGRPEYEARAIRMAEWESAIQFPDGGVRAGTLDAAIQVPTIFNTGQVMFGWLAAWQRTHEQQFRQSLVRAAEWVLEAQDSDGAWRRFGSPFSAKALNTYNTRVAYALALTGSVLGEQRYIDAGVRNIHWALTQMHENGWLENNDLQDNTKPLTHTIAYAIRGILEVGIITGDSRFLEAAERAAVAVEGTQRRDGALPGRLNSSWNAACRWTCVTGNVQMAVIWQRLAKVGGLTHLRRAAQLAIQSACVIQDTRTRNLPTQGGLPGSWPVRGGYMRYRYPNWAAKFFMDALMLATEA